MSEAKHTPGPWRFYLNANGDQWTVDSDTNADHLLVVSCGPPENEYSEANARLIAAAPDLLTACEAVSKFLFNTLKEDDFYGWELLQHLRTAIKKATGKDVPA